MEKKHPYSESLIAVVNFLSFHGEDGEPVCMVLSQMKTQFCPVQVLERCLRLIPSSISVELVYQHQAEEYQEKSAWPTENIG